MQFGQLRPLSDLGMAAWPALRRLDLSGCEDGVWVSNNNNNNSPRAAEAYALQHWLANSPALESLDVSRSIGIREPRPVASKLFRALAAAPRCLASLVMTDLGLTDVLLSGLVHIAGTRDIIAVSSESELLLPGLRSLDLSGNPLGAISLFVLAGANPANSLFPALESLSMRDSGLDLLPASGLGIPGMPVIQQFGKLRALDVFPMCIGNRISKIPDEFR